jgi:hypothetical protein
VELRQLLDEVVEIDGVIDGHMAEIAELAQDDESSTVFREHIERLEMELVFQQERKRELLLRKAALLRELYGSGLGRRK